MSIDKNGAVYTPMTEAEKRAARAVPYPEGFNRVSAMLKRWEKSPRRKQNAGD